MRHQPRALGLLIAALPSLWAGPDRGTLRTHAGHPELTDPHEAEQLILPPSGAAVLPPEHRDDHYHHRFRTDPDLVFRDAPVPDRTPRDAPLARRQLRLQARMQLQMDRRSRRAAGVDRDLYLRRARGIATWRPGERWVGRAEFDLRDADPQLLDGFFTFQLKRWSRLWVGQFKSVLSRSYLGSSGGLLFSERSLAVRAFADGNFRRKAGRDFEDLAGHGLGRMPRLRISNYWYFDKGDRSGDELGIRLRAEVAKGNEKDRIRGDLAWTVRLEIHPDGNPSYQAGARDAPKQGRLSLDFSYHRDPGQLGVDVDGDGRLTPRDRLGRSISDVGWLYRRDRFSTQAEFFRQDQRPAAPGLAQVRSSGRYVQAGWTWVPNRWETGLRFSNLDPDRATPGDTRTERAVSLVRYFDENLTKALVEVVRSTDAARPSRDETIVRLQIQQTF